MVREYDENAGRTGGRPDFGIRLPIQSALEEMPLGPFGALPTAPAFLQRPSFHFDRSPGPEIPSLAADAPPVLRQSKN
jgi:hypothetical protein